MQGTFYIFLLVVIQLNEESLRGILLDNVKGIVEQGQIAFCVKIPELFILSYHLMLNIVENFTVSLLKTSSFILSQFYY